MRTINHVLLTAAFSPENEEKLRNALSGAEISLCDAGDREGITQALEKAEIAILSGDLDDLILTGRNLKWIHCCHAGLNKSARREVFDRGIFLTGSSGRSAPALAEHAMMFMLALSYDVPALLYQQKRHIWGGISGYNQRTGLYGKTVGIIGLGKTGAELALRCKAFQMQVLGYRRSPGDVPGIDILYSADKGETVEKLLRRSDYVVLCISLNDATYHLLGERELAWMKRTAYLINMARGAVVDEEALVLSLKSGLIAGAGLDTVTEEPLEKGSPLWDLPNVMITPHVTPSLPDREERALSYVLQNIKAYSNEDPMVNQLTMRDLYTH